MTLVVVATMVVSYVRLSGQAPGLRLPLGQSACTEAPSPKQQCFQANTRFRDAVFKKSRRPVCDMVRSKSSIWQGGHPTSIEVCTCGVQDHLKTKTLFRVQGSSVDARVHIVAIVRSYNTQISVISSMLQSLLAAAEEVGAFLSVTLLNTDPQSLSDCFVDAVKNAVAAAQSKSWHVTVVRNAAKGEAVKRYTDTRPNFGYVDTDLELLWLQKHGANRGKGDQVTDVYVVDSYDRTISNAGSFDYVLFTNGDNLYIDDFFVETVGRLEKEKNASAIITSFYCKEPIHRWELRKARLKYTGIPGRIRNAAWKVGQMDLGGLVVSRRAIEADNSTFVIGYGRSFFFLLLF